MHKMKLNPKPFEAIKNGNKNVELRLYDEKRKTVCVGDIISFENVLTHETVNTKCIALHRADSFFELFEQMPKESKYGFDELEDNTDKAKAMREYYSKEDEITYGVLGIEIELA